MNCPMGCEETVTVRSSPKAGAKTIATGGPSLMVRKVKAGNLIGLQNFGIGGGSQAHLWEVWRCPQCGFVAGFYDKP